MLPANLDALTPEHIEGLVSERTAEQRTLEYKEALPGTSDADKKEFLADVSSFANAAGGHLLYGISERREEGKKTGEPEAVVGLPGPGDEVVRRLEQAIQGGMAPRIPGLSLKWLDSVDGDKAVLILRIPRSWAGPHMVTFKGGSRFFSRNSAGKYQLDVQELRAAFVAGEDAERRLRAFRDDRLGRILARNTPVPLKDGPVVVVHLLPIALGRIPRPTVDISRVDSARFRPVLSGEAGWNSHFCFDGLVTDIGIAEGYTVLFRSGAIEATLRLSLDTEPSIVHPNHIEMVAKEALGAFPHQLWTLGVEPPLVVGVALAGARGTRGPAGWRRIERPPATEDVMVFPDVLIEERTFDAGAVMRSTCDAMWQAFGFPESGSFESGRWEPENVALR